MRHINHVVMFSSGKASWAAAKLVAQKHGTDNLTLLFADTKKEDEDNYRFLQQASLNVGGKLVVVSDGRTPWQVFKDTKWINHRSANCSKYLKQKPCRHYLEENSDLKPENTVLYVGIDFNEYDRMEGIRRGWQPWIVDAPLCWDNWLTREDVSAWLQKERLKPPRMYEQGFSHANCGGFCIRAGKAHFRNLLKVNRERYLENEQQEQEFLELVGRDDIGVLRQTEKGVTRGLTLKEFRERVEAEPVQLELFDWGGCGCFS